MNPSLRDISVRQIHDAACVFQRREVACIIPEYVRHIAGSIQRFQLVRHVLAAAAGLEFDFEVGQRLGNIRFDVFVHDLVAILIRRDGDDSHLDLLFAACRILRLGRGDVVGAASIGLGFLLLHAGSNRKPLPQEAPRCL